MAHTIAAGVMVVPSAKVTVVVSAAVTRGCMVTPARASCRVLVPMTSSPRFRNRRPSRDGAGALISPVFVSHQNRSRPRTRCGSARVADPLDSATGRLRCSSVAICAPEFAAPTTRTGPSGNWSGLR